MYYCVENSCTAVVGNVKLGFHRYRARDILFASVTDCKNILDNDSISFQIIPYFQFPLSASNHLVARIRRLIILHAIMRLHRVESLYFQYFRLWPPSILKLTQSL